MPLPMRKFNMHKLSEIKKAESEANAKAMKGSKGSTPNMRPSIPRPSIPRRK